MGVATFTKQSEFPIGGSGRLVIGELAMSNSYATNGDTLDMEGDTVVAEARLGIFPGGGVQLEWDGANQKVKARWDRIQNAAAGLFVEVTATTDLSAVKVECWAILPT